LDPRQGNLSQNAKKPIPHETSLTKDLKPKNYFSL